MRKKFIGEKVLVLSENSFMNLKYFILTETKIFEEMNEKHICYGIEIESKRDNEVESKQALDITIDEDKIANICYILMKNKVTPIHLVDVISDLL